MDNELTTEDMIHLRTLISKGYMIRLKEFPSRWIEDIYPFSYSNGKVEWVYDDSQDNFMPLEGLRRLDIEILKLVSFESTEVT